ncbi:FadR family transcriptional regulator [Virgibacillus sp. NKC19-16]|uniref:FadR/GntR family transcriptional regulator n=1 Tax=Virgibacillus salidurans TaxID=2831673 RepID=UPI001F414471|nr:GntR family transcriptional regulator [Virgibacillus sp. NKC19-16]UJL47435.1 FadR family transcriptional regulator [Virgibacillus sp. NKC19-16]
MTLSFGKINLSRTISSEIVLIIKDNLLNGSLKPGDKLPTEKELMEQLGVSRTPVRESIKILEAIGVIQIKRGEGMFITNSLSQFTLNPLIFSLIMHSNNIEKLIEFRQHFEVLLMNMIITETNNIKNIEDAYHSQVKRMNSSLSPEKLANIDLEFHYAVLETTNNPFVIEIGKTIYEIIKPNMIHFKHSSNIERTLKTHHYYLELLRGNIDFNSTQLVEKMIKNNEEMIE